MKKKSYSLFSPSVYEEEGLTFWSRFRLFPSPLLGRQPLHQQREKNKIHFQAQTRSCTIYFRGDKNQVVV